MAFSVLVVCRANICRSPMAEYLLRARSGWDVASAGTVALAGHSMDAASAHALRELGVEPGEHVARQLTPAMIDAADLVLTATREHARGVTDLVEDAATKTFTLRELARLAARASDRTATLASLDAQRDAPAATHDDIGDPFAAPYAQVRACAGQVSAAVDAIVKALDR